MKRSVAVCGLTLFLVALADYRVTNSEEHSDSVKLSLALQSVPKVAYSKNLNRLETQVDYETASRIHVQIGAEGRWKVPEWVLPLPQNADSGFAPKYKFSWEENAFSFSVSRLENLEAIFDTRSSPFIFQDEYIEFSTNLDPTSHVYGLGEHVHSLELKRPLNLTFWALDIPTPPEINLYGSHPFYMEIRNGVAHGVFLKNSNGMDVQLEEDRLTYRILGGVIDLYFFMGPTPQDVIKQYWEVIGMPALPPFWSLGWHQCRYGYKNLDAVQEVVRKYKENGLPLDGVWFDIDYMNQYEDFTWDERRFNKEKVSKFVQELHQSGQHVVAIVDPGIHASREYDVFVDGIKQGIFIQDKSGSVLLGKVWPGITAFPDFFNPKTSDYWTKHIGRFLDEVAIDGLWIDMNEASNFINGSLDATQKPLKPTTRYSINNNGDHTPLNYKALDVSALHFGGIREYDVHNLYGTTEGIATRTALLSHNPKKRPFILSRSTFPGAGHHVAHWLGDNHATFESMRYSIPGALAFNMFGIPLVGADACGFLEETNEELCARWMALGAFYPFARHHHDKNSNDSFPYLWNSVKEISQIYLNARYSILSFYYTQFFKASTEAKTVIQPLFFEFGKEEETYGIDTQFLIGSSIMINPIVEAGVEEVKIYLPKGNWYDFFPVQKISLAQFPSYKKYFGSGAYVSFAADLKTMPILVRGGSIIPFQKPGATTSETKVNPYEIVAFLCEKGRASGSLVIDDGELLPEFSSFSEISMIVSGSSLRITPKVSNYRNPEETKLGAIKVAGMTVAPTQVLLNSQPAFFSFSDSTLTIPELSLSLLEEVVVTWSYAASVEK